MFSQLSAIARNTLVESIRQPVFFILILGSALLQFFNVLLSAYSMGYTEKTEVSGDDKLLLDIGLATVFVCCTLLAAFVATNVLSREIERRTVLTVISKPIPRPLFVIGKYLGVAGAILIAGIAMSVIFLFALRHGVLSTVRDPIHGPVIAFGLVAIIAAIALGIWGNFFYGWVFSSTATITLLPLLLIGYVVALNFDPHWKVQPIGTDFKPEITKACCMVLLALMVITSVAVAASTRLGQVMTIVVCAGVFLLGLMSNHLLGRHAFQNQPVGVIATVDLGSPPTALNRAGDVATIKLDALARGAYKVGAPFYYGPNPAGIAIAVPACEPFPNATEAILSDAAAVRDAKAAPTLVVRSTDRETDSLTLVNVNNLPVGRPPRSGDYAFSHTTKRNTAAWAAWSAVPNLQFFWLVDAITQGHKVPNRYVGLVAAYAGVQITALLTVAVLLFQRRDVG